MIEQVKISLQFRFRRSITNPITQSGPDDCVDMSSGVYHLIGVEDYQRKHTT